MKDEIIKKTYEIIFIRNENITFRKIANELNISLGSINYHFSSKQNLLMEVVKLQMLPIIEIVDNSTTTVNDIIEVLMNNFNVIKRIRNNPDLAGEVVRTIQSSILPTVLAKVTEIFSKNYDNVDENKVLIFILGLQQLAINSDLNNQTLKLDFSDDTEIHKLIKSILD